MSTDETRVDGQLLGDLDEPGSDDRLDDDVTTLLARDVREFPETTDVVDEPTGVDE
jgi:hypothetical protein